MCKSDECTDPVLLEVNTFIKNWCPLLRLEEMSHFDSCHSPHLHTQIISGASVVAPSEN